MFFVSIYVDKLRLISIMLRPTKASYLLAIGDKANLAFLALMHWLSFAIKNQLLKSHDTAQKNEDWEEEGGANIAHFLDGGGGQQTWEKIRSFRGRVFSTIEISA